MFDCLFPSVLSLLSLSSYPFILLLRYIPHPKSRSSGIPPHIHFLFPIFFSLGYPPLQSALIFVSRTRNSIHCWLSIYCCLATLWAFYNGKIRWMWEAWGVQQTRLTFFLVPYTFHKKRTINNFLLLLIFSRAHSTLSLGIPYLISFNWLHSFFFQILIHCKLSHACVAYGFHWGALSCYEIQSKTSFHIANTRKIVLSCSSFLFCHFRIFCLFFRASSSSSAVSHFFAFIQYDGSNKSSGKRAPYILTVWRKSLKLWFLWKLMVLSIDWT